MQLPKGLCGDVPLDLATLQGRIVRLELVTVSFTADAILTELHKEAVLLSAATIGLSYPPRRSIFNNKVAWRLTTSGVDGWRLLARDGWPAEQFMLLPIFTAKGPLEAKLNELEGRLPFLELKEHEGKLSNRHWRGLHLTAIALLQSVLPKGV